MIIIRATEAPVFSLPGITITGLAAPSRGSSEICAWLLTVEAGFDPGEAHVVDEDEVFVVIDGSLNWGVDKEEVGAGDAVVIPAGEPIRFTNPGDRSARLLVAIRSGFIATQADGTSVGTPPWAV